MVRQPNELFDKAKIKKYCKDVKITDEQRDAAKEWLGLLSENKLEKEDQNRSIFENIILQKILSYTVYDYVPEKANIDYTVENRESGKSLCIEVKGTSTKDLFAYQNRGKKDQENPIKQTWGYMGEGFDYGLCTNYEEFILLSRNVGLQKFYRFNFSSLKGIQNKLDEEKLKEFIVIFSKQKIFDEDIVTKLTTESTLAEQEFTDEFYKLYHETRLMLIKEFSSLPDVSKTEAIHWAQIFLNRLIFIFFVEDHNFIPDKIFHKRIMDIIKSSSISDDTKLISENITGLFKIMNIGSKVHGIYGFNGGLFEKEIPSKIFFADLKDTQFFKDVKKNSKLSKKSLAIDIDINLSNRYADQLNPIIKNLLDMDSYDFTSDLNVNILGHIFEQSISDLEELHDEKSSKRRREGVFYTPEYITDYICKNAIIPYLSKSNVNTISELIEEYSESIGELENKIKEIKIVDPACGSGAFLIKAVDVLLEIYKEIQNLKPQIPDQTQLKNWSEESEISKIVESNVYGVDINEESVEITRLSLFLKLAGPNRKLISLSKNIKMGNSLINEKSVDEKAFDWNKEFPEVMHEKYGGFDIIIGNPPYVRVQLLEHKIIDWFKKNKKTAYKRIDISTLFFELAKNLLKKKGIVSFITSNQFQVTDYGKKTRKFILENFKILQIINFGDLPIFDDALTYVSIFTFQNDIPSDFKYLRVWNMEYAKRIDLNDSITIRLSSLNENSWILAEKTNLKLLDKLKEHPKIGEIGNAGTGLFTGLDELLLFDAKQIMSLKLENEIILPVLRGTELERYSDVKAGIFVIYPYKLENGKTRILTELELQRYPNIYKYLLSNKEKLLERKDSRKTFKDKKDWFGLTRFGHLEIFNRDKIITPGEVREHKFTIDRSKAGFLNARIFSVVIDDKNYNLKYVLALLNSTVVKFFLRNTAPLKKGGYFAYSSKFLNDVPIPHMDSEDQNKLITRVDKIYDLNNLRKERKENFLNRIKINLGINMSKKLEDLETMEFIDFIKELRKQKKALSLKDQDEWENYFNENRDNLVKLKEEIKKMEIQIDEIVYDIYGITNEEKKIIETIY